MFKKIVLFIGFILSLIGASIAKNIIKALILDNHALLRATKKDDLEQVKKLLSQGMSPNVKNSDDLSVLMLAIYQGNPKMVQLLLEHGADINYKAGFNKLSPISITAASDLHIDIKLKIIKILLDFGANINDKNAAGTPLLLYVIDSISFGHDNIDLFDFLLKQGVEVNVADIETGITPLMHAVSIGNSHIVDALLKKGAEVNVCDKNKETALHKAIMTPYRDINIIQKLLSNKANVHIKDEFGQDLMLSVILFGTIDIFNLLLKYGAYFDNSILEKEKLIVMFRNIKNNSIESIELLLKK